MPASLDTLTKNLPEDKFLAVENTFGVENLDLLRRKGVFCYDYVTSLAKLEEISLPPIEQVHNKLYEQECSESDYQHAMKVWERFGCKTIRECSIIYETLDVCILHDVYQAFRGGCLDTYNSDPCWNFTSPGLASHAALHHTQVKLDLLEDHEMLFMVEKAIKGVVAQVVKRKVEASNPYLRSEMQNQENIMYLDANNLYGWAMSQCLPTGGFEFVSVAENPHIDILNLEHLDTDGEKGYIFEEDVS
ncbi:hypothetical protein B566_EDAN004493 [Ephemera danica]|nr:hypothetical protein B566_EDAN004493 [Ephemera danica]